MKVCEVDAISGETVNVRSLDLAAKRADVAEPHIIREHDKNVRTFWRRFLWRFCRCSIRSLIAATPNGHQDQYYGYTGYLGSRLHQHGQISFPNWLCEAHDMLLVLIDISHRQPRLGSSGRHPSLLKGSEDSWLSVPTFRRVWLCRCNW